MTQTPTEKYRAIVWWHKQTGSFDYYINNQCQMAIQSNAPLDAIYRRQDKTWATLRDITNPATIAQAVKDGLMAPPV